MLPTSTRADEAGTIRVLRDVFGFYSFLPNQEEIVRAILARQDAFVVMPTGEGSRCATSLPAAQRSRGLGFPPTLWTGPASLSDPLILLVARCDVVALVGSSCRRQLTQNPRDLKAAVDIDTDTGITYSPRLSLGGD